MYTDSGSGYGASPLITAAPNLQITNLQKGLTYTFKVVASNVFGDASVFSTISIVTADIPSQVPSVILS